jgi:hypothetical protein
MKKRITTLLGILILVPLVSGQSTFRNLGFEQAILVPVGDPGDPLKLVVASSALPYWTTYIGSISVGTIAYNSLSIGSPFVSIHDSASPYQQPLNGSYSVVLQHSGVDATSASIGQSGQLPAGSMSLLINSEGYQNLQVTFQGNVLPLFLLDTTANYAVVGADISSLAGQTGELRFGEIGQSISPVALDAIRFSTVAVPEPGALALAGIGSLILILRVWRRP